MTTNIGYDDKFPPSTGHIETMKQALDALEAASYAKLTDGTYLDKDCKITFAITALRAALAQPDEPVAWSYELATYIDGDLRGRGWECRLSRYAPSVPIGMVRKLTPLYLHPAPYVPLTDKQIHELDPCPHGMFDKQRLDFARAIEQAVRGNNPCQPSE